MPIKVLVIDDNEVYRSQIAAQLQGNGYAASTAGSSDALIRFIEIQPEIVVTEIVMAQQEGLELIRKLRQLRGDLIIVATNGGVRARSYLRVAQLLGANAALEKPFSADELLVILPSSRSFSSN